MTFTIYINEKTKIIVVNRYYNKKKTRLKRRVEKEEKLSTVKNIM